MPNASGFESVSDFRADRRPARLPVRPAVPLLRCPFRFRSQRSVIDLRSSSSVTLRYRWVCCTLEWPNIS
jgi:hypothetical protein